MAVFSHVMQLHTFGYVAFVSNHTFAGNLCLYGTVYGVRKMVGETRERSSTRLGKNQIQGLAHKS